VTCIPSCLNVLKLTLRLKMSEHQETAKHVIDVLSILTVIGTLVDMLPSIAALISIIWSVIRIYETKTVQKWLGKTVVTKED